MSHSDIGWPSATPRADFLSACRVLELSTRASGAYAGRLLALFGADVHRVDLPPSYDCRPDELAAVRASLDEYKTCIRPDDHDAMAANLASCDLVLTD